MKRAFLVFCADALAVLLAPVVGGMAFYFALLAGWGLFSFAAFVVGLVPTVLYIWMLRVCLFPQEPQQPQEEATINGEGEQPPEDLNEQIVKKTLPMGDGDLSFVPEE